MQVNGREAEPENLRRPLRRLLISPVIQQGALNKFIMEKEIHQWPDLADGVVSGGEKGQNRRGVL